MRDPPAVRTYKLFKPNIPEGHTYHCNRFLNSQKHSGLPLVKFTQLIISKNLFFKQLGFAPLDSIRNILHMVRLLWRCRQEKRYKRGLPPGAHVPSFGQNPYLGPCRFLGHAGLRSYPEEN